MDADIIPLRLFSEILGGGMASRLFQEAREKRGLAYAVDSWATPYRDGGVFGVYAGCAPGDAAALQALILEVLAQLARAPSEDELARAKAQFQTSLFLNHENAASRASTFASHLSVFGRILSLDEVAAEIASVTRDDLVRMGENIIGQGMYASACLGPKSMILVA
jgi:predicted Zn-dependent peptidase